MTRVVDVLTHVQFVVDEKGKPTAALVDIETWRRLVALFEEVEDQEVIRAYLEQRQDATSPEQMGLLPWGQLDEALETLE